MGAAPDKLVDFEQALAIVREAATRMHARATEQVGLLAAAGRVLAADILADRDQPPFARSTRDGFAVRAAETGNALRIAGQIRAGATPGALAAGEAVEIMTGAALPEGADAVVMVEHVVRDGEAVQLAAGRTIAEGENVVPRGAEARAGDVLLRAGTRVGAAEIAVAANCGCAELAVYAKPMVAIVATGDELVEVRETPGPFQIRNSNSYTIAAMVAAAGGAPGRLEIARDVRTEIRERIAQGRVWDLMVLSGGVSMGEYDLVEEVLGEFGAEFLFTGVRMQPGKPVVFGRLPVSGTERECYFFGLPGNPVSTEVTFHCFVETFVRALAGEDSAEPRWALAKLAEDVAAKAGLTRLLPARMTGVEVAVVPWQGSGDVAANARANCYVELLPGRAYAAGEMARVLLR
jgi:molybdopterin molybdotransferase